LDFNYRVLAEAVNEDNPLLERGKFISIVSSNLDEFFMIRVGALCHSLEEGVEKKDPSGMTVAQQLSAVRREALRQVEKQYNILQQKLLPLLAREGIHILSPKMLDNKQTAWINSYFDREVQPLLSPWAVNAQRPFPLLAAKQIHIALLLPPQARGGSLRFALVTVPSGLKRVVLLPAGIGRTRGVLIEDVISMNLSKLFGGIKPLAWVPFRLTRNADFLYNDSNANLLIAEMRKNLKRRKWGKVVRLEVPRGSDERLMIRLRKYLCISDKETVYIPGPLDLTFFMKEIASYPEYDDLRFAPFTPFTDERFSSSDDIFRTIRQGDMLVHHPYDSFDPVIRFVCDSADDPNVMAIKQTLYRVSGESPIVASLARAARNGKQVTVLIEVRARFDEENNINWCLELEKAGCHVYYGVPKLKTHSKITLVVRREDGGLRSYVHLGTGNYNDSTARLYTDFGLFTCDDTIGKDAGAFFNMVTGYGGLAEMDKLSAAPYELRRTISRLVRDEIHHARGGRGASSWSKINSLCDPKMIRLLYKAADEGVEIHLLVRGICCIRPGGRANIHIRSIVGRFLEHARIYVFNNAGDPKVFLSSADLMPRNLDKRVELMFPIEDADIRARLIATMRDEWRDNTKAWEMKKNGTYRRVRRELPLMNVQEARILSQAMPEDLSPLLDDDDIEKIDRRDREEDDGLMIADALPREDAEFTGAMESPDGIEYGDTMELEHESDYTEQEIDDLPETPEEDSEESSDPFGDKEDKSEPFD
ncbi:MAG: polyphosphate kinase 1, partial [Lachnospiraceae bacterium]|nr:polyphosphate kinase 1 [Lachnospiraceae bacterium]